MGQKQRHVGRLLRESRQLIGPPAFTDGWVDTVNRALVAAVTPPPYVELRYQCPGCGAVGPVQLMARDRDESLFDFVERAKVAVYIAHMNNSRECKAPAAKLNIPLTASGFNGKPVR